MTTKIMSTHEFEEQPLPRPHPTYVHELRRVVKEQLGVPHRSAPLVGLSESTLGRLLNLGRGTLNSAIDAFRALRQSGVDFPPPWTPVIDRDDYDWIDLGRNLRVNNPDVFAALLQLVRSAGRVARHSLDEQAKLDSAVRGTTVSPRRGAILHGDDDDENE